MVIWDEDGAFLTNHRSLQEFFIFFRKKLSLSLSLSIEQSKNGIYQSIELEKLWKNQLSKSAERSLGPIYMGSKYKICHFMDFLTLWKINSCKETANFFTRNIILMQMASFLLLTGFEMRPFEILVFFVIDGRVGWWKMRNLHNAPRWTGWSCKRW